MESLIYQLLKEKKTSELIAEIKKNEALLHFTDSKGVSLLALSYYFRNQELSDFILTHRSPKNIFEASMAGMTDEVVQYLNENPEVINAHSPDGFTPLGFASYFSRVETAKRLLQESANPNIAASNSFCVAPIHSAVAANSYEITKCLLEHGADVNALQQNNVTALHSAAQHGNVKIVKLLLEHGANRNAKMDDGRTPLDLAKEVNAAAVIDLLTQ